MDKRGRFAIVNASLEREGFYLSICTHSCCVADHIVLFNASNPTPIQVFKTEGAVEVIFREISMKFQTITFISAGALNELGVASNSALVYVTNDSQIFVLEEFDVEISMTSLENKPIVCSPSSHFLT